MPEIDNIKVLSLLSSIKNRDKEAFKEFFKLFQPGIFHFLYRFTSDIDAVDDLTQETFIKFWESIDKVDLAQSPKAYLYKIAKNLALNYVSRRPPVSSFEECENLLILMSRNSQPDYNSMFLNDDFQKAINMLPERCRMTFVLSRFNEMEYSEIAEIMNVSLQTVKNQMNKALSILRKQLSSYLN